MQPEGLKVEIPTNDDIDQMGRREKRQLVMRIVTNCTLCGCSECPFASEHDKCRPKQALRYLVDKLTARVGDDIELYR